VHEGFHNLLEVRFLFSCRTLVGRVWNLAGKMVLVRRIVLIIGRLEVVGMVWP